MGGTSIERRAEDLEDPVLNSRAGTDENPRTAAESVAVWTFSAFMCADCVAWLFSQLRPDSFWPSSSASLLHNTNIMLSKITSIFFALAVPFVWYVYFQRVSTANRREQPRPPSVFGVHTVVYMCSCVYMTTRAMFRWSIHSWSDWMTQGAYGFCTLPVVLWIADVRARFAYACANIEEAVQKNDEGAFELSVHSAQKLCQAVRRVTWVLHLCVFLTVINFRLQLC